VKVKGLRGEFVDKTRQIYKNPKLAKEILEEMFGEFLVAKDLQHENIIQYKYFMRNHDPIN